MYECTGSPRWVKRENYRTIEGGLCGALVNVERKQVSTCGYLRAFESGPGSRFNRPSPSSISHAASRRLGRTWSARGLDFGSSVRLRRLTSKHLKHSNDEANTLRWRVSATLTCHPSVKNSMSHECAGTSWVDYR